MTPEQEAQAHRKIRRIVKRQGFVTAEGLIHSHGVAPKLACYLLDSMSSRGLLSNDSGRYASMDRQARFSLAVRASETRLDMPDDLGGPKDFVSADRWRMTIAASWED